MILYIVIDFINIVYIRKYSSVQISRKVRDKRKV